MLKTIPKAAKNLKGWLASWISTVAQGHVLKLSETEGTRSIKDIFIALRSKKPEYATTVFRKIYQAKTMGTTDKLQSFDNYVNKITRLWRCTQPHSTDLSVNATAKLDAAKPADTTTQTTGGNQNKNSGQKPTPECICGLKHWYVDCFIINDKHPKRPLNFTPLPATAKKVVNARKDINIEKRIQNALQQWNKHNQQTVLAQAVQIDNGQAPALEDFYATIMDSPQLTSIHMDLVQKALTKTTTVEVKETCLSWLQLSSIADPVTVDNQREEDAPLITLSINDTCSISDKLLT